MFFDNRNVVAHNWHRLALLNAPIVRLTSENCSREARLAPTEDTGGLANVEYLAIGARTMLTWNMDADMGLVNGALGTVLDIFYTDDTDHEEGILPYAVVVQFDVLAPDIDPFVPRVARTVAVPLKMTR